jgi:hypothetical protein
MSGTHARKCQARQADARAFPALLFHLQPLLLSKVDPQPLVLETTTKKDSMAAPTSSKSPKQVDGTGGGKGGGASAPDDNNGACAAGVDVQPTLRSREGGGSSSPNDGGAADSPADAEPIPSLDGDAKASAATTTEAKDDDDDDEAGPSAANGPAAGPTSATTKDPPVDAAAATVAAATGTSTMMMIPTYESVEASELYQTALSLMREGEFEDCIELVEQGIDDLKETLAAALRAEEEGSGAGSVDVHPSMAPYYYLYGTALLYKVEEQDLNSGAVGGGAVADAAASSPPSAFGGGNDNDDDDEEGQEYYNGEDEDDAADKVEDLQVAWEFLESARGLLEKLIATTAPAEEGGRADKYRADLAQVRLREGDLNRMNGQSQAAVADYQASLEYLEGCAARVGPYSRKVADLHYNLGLLCTLEAAAASEPASAAPPDASNPMLAALMPAMLPPQPQQKALSGREKAALRSRGVYHFWQCCQVLAGQLAMLCGVDDPSEILDRAERTVANLKSVGGGTSKLGDGAAGDAEGDKAEHPAIVSRKLSNLRADLALLLPSSAAAAATGNDAGQGPMDPVAELVQLLDDIQETIDEVERSEEGIQQVTEMKAEITAAAAAASGNAADEGNGDGHGFGSAAAAATSASAQPILAVKKKAKKRDAADASLKDDREPGDSKRAAAE